MPARNTLVQLLAVYTNTESRNAQRHRQTDRRTRGWCQYPIILCSQDKTKLIKNTRSSRLSFTSNMHKTVVSWWSLSTKLLYTGSGYYLDGWLSVDRAKHLGM